MDIDKINKMGRELIDIFNLDTSPVSISLIPSTHDVPEGIQRLEDASRHCQMIDNVRREGISYYTLVDDHKCKGGAAAIGLCAMTQSLETGDFYYKLKRFNTINAARRTMQQIPVIPPESIKSLVYAPLEKTSLAPDVVVIISNPEKIMKISQGLLYKHGGRVNASFAGIQSLCADSVAQPYLYGTAGVTIGCSGSRKYTQIKDSEMIIGIPAEQLEDLVEAAKKMFPPKAD